MSARRPTNFGRRPSTIAQGHSRSLQATRAQLDRQPPGAGFGGALPPTASWSCASCGFPNPAARGSCRYCGEKGGQAR